MEEVVEMAASVGGGAVVATQVGTAVLGAVGFTGNGVAAGSLAAVAQAGIGNIVGGSLFAACQSAGALGGLALLGPVGLAGGALGAVGYYFW